MSDKFYKVSSGTWYSEATVSKLKAECLRLNEQITHLEKAGNGLVGLIEEMDVILDMDCDHKEVADWHAAKEGKPTK